jgi:hypothetical protein
MQAYYRFEVNIIGRSGAKQGSRSVVYAAAYRAGQALYFEREGTVADYTRRQGKIESGLMAPDAVPAWALEREALWNQVEKAENRKDAQLARELLVAFPHQLDAEQRREALTDFIGRQVTSRGMIADWNIHSGGREGDERNHHAHILLTMRTVSADGFGNKERAWNAPELLQAWRSEWANTLNQTFERYGMCDAEGERYFVDHRSYDRQGVDREPGIHLGPHVAAMERRGEPTERGDINRDVAARNAQRQQLYREAAELDEELAAVRAEIKREVELLRRRSQYLTSDAAESKLKAPTRKLTFFEETEASNDNEPEPRMGIG